MNTQIVDELVRRTNAHQNRRASLAALSAIAMAAAAGTPAAAAAQAKNKHAQKRKSCNKVKKKVLEEADLRCKVQVPTCETALSAVCQPGPEVQECLDNTSACCESLATCDAQAAMECVVARFIVA